MRQIIYVIACAMVLVFPAQAEEKLALVIANSNYSSDIGKLANPVNDAVLVQRSLEAIGFDVTVVYDADQRSMKRVIRDHKQRIATAGDDAVSFFYYSGHGAADPKMGQNYLIPLAAEISTPSDLDIEAVPLRNFVNAFSGAQYNFLVVDACRNFPFPFADSRSIQKGFVPQPKVQGTLIAFATAPGRTASDAGENGGPYARALAKRLIERGADHVRTFKNVQTDVYNETGRVQFPWFEDGVPGYYQFQTGSASETAPVTAMNTPSTTSPIGASKSVPHLLNFVDARTAKLETAAPLISEDPATLPDFALFKECYSCPDMVVLPAGTFKWQTIANGTQLSGPLREAPVKRFAISRFELSSHQWTACVESGKCSTDDPYYGVDIRQTLPFNIASELLSHAADDGSSIEVDAYLSFVSDNAGRTYRLPSEAEWVYASLSGASTQYHWGNEPPSCDRDADNGANVDACRPEGPPYHLPIGSFKPNAFGLFDMFGGVQELTTACGEETDIRISEQCGGYVVRGGDDHFVTNWDPAIGPVDERLPDTFWFSGIRLALSLN